MCFFSLVCQYIYVNHHFILKTFLTLSLSLYISDLSVCYRYDLQFIIGPLFFFMFVGIAFLVVLNIIIAIIADAYVEANERRKIDMRKKKFLEDARIADAIAVRLQKKSNERKTGLSALKFNMKNNISKVVPSSLQKRSSINNNNNVTSSVEVTPIDNSQNENQIGTHGSIHDNAEEVIAKLEENEKMKKEEKQQHVADWLDSEIAREHHGDDSDQDDNHTPHRRVLGGKKHFISHEDDGISSITSSDEIVSHDDEEDEPHNDDNGLSPQEQELQATV